MLTFDEVREEELIPDHILDWIPEKCEVCGGDLVFTDSLTFLACSNPRCYSKVAARIESMCKFLQIDGFGEETCRTIAKTFNLMGPAQLLLVAKTKDNVPGVSGWETKRQNAIKGMGKEISLWEYLKALNLPGISGKARELLSDYDSLEDFYADLEEQQVALVAARLGIKADLDSGVLAVNTYNTLMQYKGEVMGCVKMFNIKKENRDAVTINVCITQKVPGFTSKPAFIEYLRSQVSENLNILQVDRVTEKTHILVGDINSTTTKMKRAKQINEKEGKQMIFIGGPDEVLEFIQEIDDKLNS